MTAFILGASHTKIGRTTMETQVTGGTALGEISSKTEPVAKLRHLDVDDLYLMSFLSQGLRLVDAAKRLSLTQPAITQRIHKIEQALGIELLDRNIRGTRLSLKGQVVCKASHDAVEMLEKLI